MVTVPVSQLKSGDTISEDVLTKYNNVILPKGRMISDRDLEVLRAFLISSVHIEAKTGESVVASEESVMEEQKHTGSVSLFYEQYEKMLQLMRRVYNIANAGGQNLPILEIRTNLEKLIQYIDQYKVLTFSPRHFQLSDFIYHNGIMVSLTSYNLAKWHGLPTKDLMPIALGGLLHDIGNAKVDAGILFKPSKLNADEREDMKKHTIIGYNLLKSVPAINDGVRLCALQHHEREDGSGYPLGVRGDKIHLYSKIVAITDVFHAMRTNRYHKTGVSPYLVLEQLLNESFGKLDPALVQTFIHKVTSFHNGTVVKLSDNQVGEIIFSDRSHPTRPWVNVNGKIINLTIERNLYIQDVIET